MNALPETRPNHRVHTAVILLLLLLAAGLLRGVELADPGYTLDELWTAEVASGRGSMHLHLPVNQPMAAPELFSLDGAPTAWHVWTRMEVTHPPMYYILLRLWMQLFGQGDITERLLSVICSMGAVALLFDLVCRTSGRGVAIWACLLMIAASPQVDFARKTRNYALAFLLLLAAADALVRIEKSGLNPRRLAVLVLATLASLLTHYFCGGTVLALGMFALLRLRGRDRRIVLSGFALAGISLLISWGPFFWLQRPLLAVTDPGVNFVHDLQPGHVLRVLHLLVFAPATLLVARIHLNEFACLSGLLLVFPFLLLKRRPDLLLWSLWLTCTIGAVALLDLCRDSLHLGFVRYVSMAGPGLYALIPALCGSMRWRWLRHGIPALTLLATALFTSDAYINPAADPRTIADLIRPKITSRDVLIFASRSDAPWYRGTQYLMLSRYLRPIPCPVIFLDAPPTGEALKTILAARGEFVFTSATAPTFFLPGFEQRDSVPLPSWGRLTLMVPAGAALRK